MTVALPAEADLEVVARDLYVAARAAVSTEIALAEDAFVARAIATIRDRAEPLAALRALHAGDLFVALALVAGDRAAFIEIDRRLRAQVELAVRGVGDSAGFLDDLGSALRDHLLVPAQVGAAPRIATYAGTGPLDGWLRVTATREAVRMRRLAMRDARADRGDDADDELAALPGELAPELAFLKSRYGEHVRAGIRAAIRELDDRQQSLLRLHYGEGLGVEQLGQMYRVHFSTVSRWIAAARDRLFAGTRAHVRAALGVDDREFEDLMDLVRSQLDMTISLFARS